MVVIAYLSSPGSQMHADHCRGMPVLLSYGHDGKAKWMSDYIPSFGRVLIDSGAYTEFNSGKLIDLEAYAEWSDGVVRKDAVAALDDIRGNWERGLENWKRFPWMFPTYHSSDPEEALTEILKANPKWIGLGMVPTRDKERWLDAALDRLQDYAGHVHGWALGTYANKPRLDSFDSTSWWRDALDLKAKSYTRHLTTAECVEIVVKRYQRAMWEKKTPRSDGQGDLFCDTE